jgi:hypothetical protein
MTLIAKRIVPIEVRFTGNEGVEELFLTKEVEDPGLLKVRAMVGQ